MLLKYCASVTVAASHRAVQSLWLPAGWRINLLTRFASGWRTEDFPNLYCAVLPVRPRRFPPPPPPPPTNINCVTVKGFVILTIVFPTRIETVEMLLWDDTRIFPCDSQLWAIQWLQEKLNMLQRLGSLLGHQISAIHSKRALFPYNDSCHVNYSADKLSVP